MLDMNKDLSQVSQKIRYDYIVELHSFAFNLIWKLKEEFQWQKRQQIMTDFNKRKP